MQKFKTVKRKKEKERMEEEEKKYTNKNDAFIIFSGVPRSHLLQFGYFVSWMSHTPLAKLSQPRLNPRLWSAPR